MTAAASHRLTMFFGITSLALTSINCGSGCSGGTSSSSSSGPDKLAHLIFKLKVEGPNEIALKDYNITATWHGDLVSGQGTEGNTNPFDVQHTYTGTTDTSGDYVVTQIIGNERPGTWHLTAAANGWSASCQQTLQAAVNTSINFTFGKPGCGTGFSFP